MPLVVTESCKNCQDCLPTCPVDCFFTDGKADRVYINPRECISCLCCYLVCPHDAIFTVDKVPDAQSAWIKTNDLRSNGPDAIRLKSSGMRRSTPTVVQGRSAATASRGQQRVKNKMPSWWKQAPSKRKPTPTYDTSAGGLIADEIQPTDRNPNRK